MIRSGIIVFGAALVSAACFGQNTTAVHSAPQGSTLLPSLADLPPSPTSRVSPANRVVSPSARMPVAPHLAFNSVSNIEVHDLHLRPLFITAIHVPEAVSSLNVGDRAQFDVEHSEAEPNLVFVRPSTHQAAESNLFIAMISGRTISVRLISPGDAGSSDPVDFVVDYRARKSLFEASDGTRREATSPEMERVNPTSTTAGLPVVDSSTALSRQGMVGAPHWMTASELAKLIKANALAPNNIAIAVGDIRQEGGSMTVSFSVLNISDHWITIMPPQVELTNPLISKKQAKKKGNFAQPISSSDYRLDHPKLSPGARADGSITFPKPDSKITRESLLLHIATSASIDTPVYYPLPFVAPSPAELISQQEGDHASN